MGTGRPGLGRDHGLSMRVAYVGLGNMGAPMARNAQRAGHDLRVFDVRADALTPLTELGARPGSSAADAAAGVDVVCVTVLDGPQVDAAMSGPDGVFAGAAPETVVAIHSTVHPETIHTIAGQAPAGVEVLDAPISGGVKGARDATLCVMVGGPTRAFERARPVFDAVGDLVLHLGDRGAGLAAKLARNLVGYVTMLAAQEGRQLAAAAGTDLEQLNEILEHTGALSPMMRDLLSVPGGDAVYSDDVAPLVALAAKDLQVTLAFADQLGVDLPAAALTLDRVAFSFGVPDQDRDG
jgi:3-hydroxyisobutyrate dehydrogenase-like beta-hydroxyacid dehydrogenase